MATKLEVQILGDFKDLAKATRGAEGQLKNLNKKVSKFSSSMKGSLATIGIGLSFSAITSALGDATRAALDDRKGQIILADAMEKTIGASKEQIATTEDYISGLQRKTGILDDDLRPAYATALRAMKDEKKAQDILNISTDVATATGKDLTTVVKSVSRAYDGNVTGLQKLVPGIKKGIDPMEQLKEMFSGVAEEANNLDPLNKVNVIFNDIQEEIGLKLLPYLDEFATWLSSEEGSAFLDGVLETIKAIIDGIATVIKGFSDMQSVGNQVNSDPEVMNLLQISKVGTNAGGLENIGRNTTGPNMGTFVAPNIPKMATGGVVMPSVGGSIVNVAEAGQPEAIIPLDRLNGMNGGNTYNVYFTKATPNPSEIVATLKNYERQTGTKILK